MNLEVLPLFWYLLISWTISSWEGENRNYWVFDDLGLAPFEEHDGLEDIVQLDPPLLGGALLVALLPLHWHVELLPLLPVRLPQGLLLSLVSQVRSHCKGWLEIFLHSLVEVLLC
mmetsp:Transcript_5242/g.4835  ORF Transcript_5242/g.4835 Transcript_5242/m.4835 type:complete len:115 (-) Transcript_5242:1095-1439(-)